MQRSFQKSKYIHAFLVGGSSVFYNSATMELWEGDDCDYAFLQQYEHSCPIDETSPVAQTFVEHGLIIQADHPEQNRAINYLKALRARRLTERKGHVGYLRLSLTERCNLACTYCFIEDFLADHPSMPPERFMKIMSWFIRMNRGQSPSIQYFGGEPMLRMDLIGLGNSMLSEAKSAGQIHDYYQMVVTNGTLMNEEHAQFFVKNNVNVIFSIDGWKEINDQKRVDRQGRGSFEALLRGINIYKQNGGNLKCLVTLQPHNAAVLPSIVEFLVNDLGAVEVAINASQPTAEGWQIDGELLANVVQQSWLFCNAHHVRFHSPGTHIVAMINGRTPQVDRCFDSSMHMQHATWGAYVSAEGVLSMCTVWHRDERVVQSNLEDLVSTAKFRNWHYPETVESQCDCCIASLICGGPCSLELMLNGGKLNPDRCRFFQKMVPWIVQQSIQSEGDPQLIIDEPELSSEKDHFWIS